MALFLIIIRSNQYLLYVGSSLVGRPILGSRHWHLRHNPGGRGLRRLHRPLSIPLPFPRRSQVWLNKMMIIQTQQVKLIPPEKRTCGCAVVRSTCSAPLIYPWSASIGSSVSLEQSSYSWESCCTSQLWVTRGKKCSTLIQHVPHLIRVQRGVNLKEVIQTISN